MLLILLSLDIMATHYWQLMATYALSMLDSCVSWKHALNPQSEEQQKGMSYWRAGFLLCFFFFKWDVEPGQLAA